MVPKNTRNVNRRGRDTYIDSDLFRTTWLDDWVSDCDAGDDESTRVRDIQHYCEYCDSFHLPGECECA